MTLDNMISLFVLTSHRTEPVGPVGKFFIVLITLAIGGLIALVGVGYLQTYFRVRKTDPREIRTLTDPSGEVELTGTVRAHEETVRSPFTDTECVAIDWRVEQYRGSGEGSNWTRLDSGDARHPFRLDDGTGIALVDPNGGTLEMIDEEVIEVEPDERPPPGVSDYLDESNVDHEHDRQRKYTEKRLAVGEDVHVFGPIRRVAHTVDMPGGADVVVGVDDPDWGFTIGEDSLSDLTIGTDTELFNITSAGEQQAERHMFKKGAMLVVFGAVFGLSPLVMIVAL